MGSSPGAEVTAELTTEAAGVGSGEEKPKMGTNQQQQLHHAQAVVLHGVDEWGAAALDVLREGRSLSHPFSAGSEHPSLWSSLRRFRHLNPPWLPLRAPPPRPHPRARPRPSPPASLAHHCVDVSTALQEQQNSLLAPGVHGHVQSGEP